MGQWEFIKRMNDKWTSFLVKKKGANLIRKQPSPPPEAGDKCWHQAALKKEAHPLCEMRKMKEKTT